jgi:hypothetical protein
VTVYAYPTGEDRLVGRTFAPCTADAMAGGAAVRCDLVATTRPR